MYYFIKALRFKNTVAKKEPRNVDVLMIDDNSFQGRTQRRGFHTFNALVIRINNNYFRR